MPDCSCCPYRCDGDGLQKLTDDGKKTDDELKSLPERVADLRARETELKQYLDAAKKQHEKEIEEEKRKNEVTPNSGARTSDLKKKLMESLEKIAALEEKNKEFRNLNYSYRYFAFCLALPCSLAHSIKLRNLSRRNRYFVFPSPRHITISARPYYCKV